MIKAICKYYLKFPPIARKAINLSVLGFMNGMGVDYCPTDAENILLECDELINNNL